MNSGKGGHTLLLPRIYAYLGLGNERRYRGEAEVRGGQRRGGIGGTTVLTEGRYWRDECTNAVQTYLTQQMCDDACVVVINHHGPVILPVIVLVIRVQLIRLSLGWGLNCSV